VGCVHTSLVGKPSSEGAAAVGLLCRGKLAAMGPFWGPGGWVGPGSRLENRTYLRWFRFLLGFLLGSLMVFLLGYFGWSSDRTEHELLASLLRALLGGVLWGLGTAAYLQWADRRARRE
jgi:hypothetical protein